MSVYDSLYKFLNTSHTQNTKATVCCGLLRSNHLAAVQLLALHPVEQIVQGAYTYNKQTSPK